MTGPAPPVAGGGAASADGLWVRWGQVTRFLKSSRVAFGRERGLWESLELTSKADVRIKLREGSFVYSAKLNEHLAALGDERFLYEGVFLLSCALAESAAVTALGLDQRRLQGIEDWGRRLLDASGSGWDEVAGGYAGAVEVAVARNVISHGNQVIDELSLRRLAKAGSTAWELGNSVVLGYETLALYRTRLASLLRAGRLG